LHADTKQTKKISHNRNKIATTLPRNVVQLIVMDIDALHSALLSITVVSEKLRSAREFLPVTETLPAGLEKFLYEMERDLRLAKATLGGELGFSLCPRCWPPELATIDTNGRLNCPVCGEISYKKAA
jgi:hypothetical protein